MLKVGTIYLISFSDDFSEYLGQYKGKTVATLGKNVQKGQSHIIN